MVAASVAPAVTTPYKGTIKSAVLVAVIIAGRVVAGIVALGIAVGGEAAAIPRPRLSRARPWHGAGV